MKRVQDICDATRRLTLSAIGPKSVAAIGVDAVDVEEFGRDLAVAGDAFLEQCFVPDELDHCAGELDKLAIRFALKEATLKVLGTGIRGIGLHDVTVVTAASGQPRMRFSQAALGVAKAQRLRNFRCTATRESGLALAVVVANPY